MITVFVHVFWKIYNVFLVFLLILAFYLFSRCTKKKKKTMKSFHRQCTCLHSNVSNQTGVNMVLLLLYIFFALFCADVYSGWSACTVCIVLHFSNYGRRNAQSETERQEQLSNPSIAFRTQTSMKEKYENILSFCALNREQLESVT